MDADDQEQGSVQCSNSQEQAGKKVKKQVPQKTIDDFWNVFTTKFPGKVHTILPQNRYAKSKAAAEPKGTVYSQAALKSYDEARAECQAAVAKIAKECKRVNMRYRDPHFDIEFDLKKSKDDCLEGLVETQHPPFQPNSVKRVHVGPLSCHDWGISNSRTRIYLTTLNSTLTRLRPAMSVKEMMEIAGFFRLSAH